MKRSSLLALAAMSMAALYASQAMAQAGEPFTDLMNMSSHAQPAHQAAATIAAPSVRLPRSAPKWIEAEARRQADSPRRVARVALDIDMALGKDVLRAARRQNIHPDDLNHAILLSVMYGAREIVARQDGDAARLERADADLKAVMPLQSETSMRLALAQ